MVLYIYTFLLNISTYICLFRYINRSGYKRPKTKCPITKHPKLYITQEQNAQCYKSSRNKTPKITKSPNFQNYKMSKVIKYPKFHLFCSFVLFLCWFDQVHNIIDKVLNIDATFHSCLYLCGLIFLTKILVFKL